jgi:hypothetical protein
MWLLEVLWIVVNAVDSGADKAAAGDEVAIYCRTTGLCLAEERCGYGGRDPEHFVYAGLQVLAPT